MGNLALVIDDELDYANIVKHKLKKQGFKVKIARSGKEGYNIAKSIKPDLITMDIMMPGEDGETVIDWLKSDNETKDIPIIVITVFENTKLEKMLKEKGVIDYIIKPIMKQDILKYLKEPCKNGRC